MAGLLTPLGRVLSGTRHAAGVFQGDIAATAGVSRAVVSRLENGHRWPEQGPDALVCAYASECSRDYLDLWQAAIDIARETQKRPPPL